MNLFYWLSIVACVLLTQAKVVGDETWTFEHAKARSLPPGWVAGATGSKAGKPPRWQVIQHDGHNVLAQLESGGARGDFPVCLRQRSVFRDGTVTVRFKPISGRIDQAGGVVLRAKDKDNFYVARANALENNVSFYVTRNGNRKTIKYWENIEVARDKWHELKVQATGFTFQIWLDGKLVGEIDDAAHTFPDAGMVGVWTKADSVTYFDTLSVVPRNGEDGSSLRDER